MDAPINQHEDFRPNPEDDEECITQRYGPDDVGDVEEFTPAHTPPPIPGEVYRYELGEEEWQVDIKNKNNTRVVMFCDDGYEQIRDLEEGWEAHVLQVAGLNDVTRIIKQIEKTEALTTVVVAVGREDRCRETEEIYRRVENLYFTIAQKELTGIFIAVNYPPDLERDEQMKLKELNVCAAVLFNDKFCTVDYPTTMKHTGIYEAWDQPKADLFVKNVTNFENWVRVSEVMGSDDEDVEN